ncbi:MAG TPA: lytic transglycosylase domain-containing protein [Pyrinomonadaceae bacterium]|nr:lytic transglycosylase domain-containing protein [Pyrinomonadaceae bacterium]
MMNLTRFVPHFRSFKFAPFAVIALFTFTNLTGILFNHAYAPAVQARETTTVAETVNVESDYIPADVPTSGDHELDQTIFRAAERYGVDPRLLHALIWQESKYKPRALSHVGAQGLMQLMPATARRFGCDDANDAASNIDAGTKYLRWLLERYHGNVSLALAGYNAGEGAVDKYKGIPPFNETQNYVRIITGRYGKTYHPLLTPEQARVEFRLLPEVAQVEQQ